MLRSNFLRCWASGVMMRTAQILIAALLIIISGASVSEPPINFDCGQPKAVSFSGVKIIITHCIDSQGPDSNGMYSFYYDYETIIFEMGNESLSGKRYSDTPEEVSLTRIKEANNERLLEVSDFNKSLVKVAISYLKNNGAETVVYLDKSNQTNGYSPVPNNDA